ncbi:hypothetical protein HPB48_014452 [Haemaphysalis longicornis]|uniref:Transposable element P transposase-like GTP-binding insertion domain-containing protein n=1 Tax=Haemaphysalis longicornis TaxID=44386 RepID=A0A9J6H0H5_HAELO|nr:hypothetical protein HPB48_014452 [Haemaphysalis longicornis]
MRQLAVPTTCNTVLVVRATLVLLRHFQPADAGSIRRLLNKKITATLKCIQDIILNAKAGAHKVNSDDFDDYKELYETEEENQLKVVPKLATSHVNPSNLQKMDLFSRSVAIVLKFYREQKTPGSASAHGTEEFTLLLNNLFDALNARLPLEGIRQNSRQIRLFFGAVRTFGSNEHHPIITNFSQVFRLLSLHPPLKMATKGNCTDKANPVLISPKQR